MGTKNEPGKFDCYSKALPDEPTFTLLGRDPAAGIVLAYWCAIRIIMSDDIEKEGEQMKEARSIISKMDDYAKSLGKANKLAEARQASSIVDSALKALDSYLVDSAAPVACEKPAEG